MDDELKNLPSISFSKYELGNIALSSLLLVYSKLTSISAAKNFVLPSDEPLLNISATRAAEDIRQGKLKSYDLVSAYLKRIRDVNHFINAATEIFEADALNTAKAVDELIEKVKENPKELEKIKSDQPLLGLPISLKHSLDYKGYRNICGLPYRRFLPPAETHSTAVERVVSAGAIPICYTNVPPGCMAFETHNAVYGRTNNPHDTRTTAGGSSGGEGALISAQGSLFGVGTDLGGSIRVPASLNGIYGFKVGLSTCPLEGSQPSVEPDDENRGLLVVGPMCRYVEDLPLLYQVLCASTLSRPISSLKPSRIYFSTPHSKPLISVASHVEEHVNDVALHLSDQYAVPNIEFNIGKDIIELFVLFFHAKFKKCLDSRDFLAPNQGFNVLKEFIKCILGSSELSMVNLLVAYGSSTIFPPEKVEECERHIKIVRNHFERTLGENSVLIFPGLPETHFFHNSLMLPACAYTAIFNAMSLPSLSVPCGRDSQGYPISVQIIGSHNSEPLIMAVAQKMEERFGGWVKPIAK